MVPELGHFAAILAFVVAVLQAVVSTAGATSGWPAWIAVGLRAARLQCLLLLVAFGCLAWSFIANDFSVLNVALNSHTRLPVGYRLAATWGSHEGSLLLWTVMLSLWGAAVAWFAVRLPADMAGRVVGVLGAVSSGFLLFMLTTSNPFLRLMPPVPEGRDLNPVLQDLAMIVHPPLLYMGYVGFSVAFAFGIGALAGGRLDAAWARWSRPWTTMAWTFLTCGIALGSFWAYYELGWGGWWFWDPVENASFMPWLCGTALMHSLAVTDRRGVFKSWTVLLAIATFSLSLLGAFLVRSGVLTSVHAFATDPARGVFLLSLFALVAGGSLALYAFRAGRVTPGGAFHRISRESFLLVNNVFLAVGAAAVLLGTVYPLVVDVLGRGKMSVGPPYFNSVFVAVMAPAMFLLGVGPIARWRQSRLPDLASRLRWALATSALAAVGIPAIVGEWKPLVGLGLLMAIWILSSVIVSLAGAAREAGGWRRLATRSQGRRRAFYGMHLAHVGVAVTILGITIVTGYQEDKDMRMTTGAVARVGRYAFTFRGTREARGANFIGTAADIDVTRTGDGDGSEGPTIARLSPQKRVYLASESAVSESAVDSGLLRDLYVSLGEPLDGEAWQVQIRYRPFVVWIWGGAMLMAIGGLLAVCDPRYGRLAPAGRRA